MKKLIVLSFAALAALSAAGSVRYAEQKGVREFTGEMIARPKQVTLLMEQGMNLPEANSLHRKAEGLVSQATVRYVEATDEYILKVPAGSSENEMSAKLMASGAFEYVEPNWRVFPVVIPNDPSYGSQWHLPKIRADLAWNHFTGWGQITVGVTDTGVRLDHQDLVSQLVSGANSATGTAIPQSSGGQVADLHGHGTHTAGIAGAAGNNALGVSGVSWNVKIMPIRVSDVASGSSSIAALTAGARWAAENGARVVSTSYSGVDSASVGTTGTYLKGTWNTVYCWAAGNDNVARTTDHVDVTVVGASDSNDAKASFSAFGVPIDVFAPGVNIYSTYFSNSSSYTFMSGTSMACPCAAGLAALITAANPSMTAQQVEDTLYQTCLDLTAAPGGVGNDGYWGWGRIDAYAALLRTYSLYPFPATSMTVNIGTLAGGNVASLKSSDDSKVDVLQQAARFGRVPGRITVESISTNGLTGRVDLILEASASVPGLTQTVEMWDFTAGAYVPVDVRIATTADSTITITPPTSTRFRQGGTGLLRARVTFTDETGLDRKNKHVYVDRAGWTTAP